MIPNPSHLEYGARKICTQLHDAGFRALFAGGCVRDRLLNLSPRDIDIATSARPEQIIQLFPKTIAVGAKFGVVVVIRPEGMFEVATFRTDGAYLDGRHPSSIIYTNEEQDAQRRDFTINALFFDPASNTVLDYVNGQKDLQAGVLRTVGEATLRFQEDRLRLLRAVRFSARLGYQIESDTWLSMKTMAHEILSTSAERIRDELIKMLTEGCAAHAFEILDRSGLLEQVLPEITAMHDVEQPAVFHPEGDVWAHTLLLLKQLPPEVSPTLALAALLHDVGKPSTQTFKDRIRFNLHDKAGAHITESLCKRLRLSNDDVQRITWLVKNHMRLRNFLNMRKHRRIRLARLEGFDELLALCRMDALASHGDSSFIDDIEEYLTELEKETLRPKPLVTGKDLIEMGYTPGPEFKRILETIETLQLEGQLIDTATAKAYTVNHFSLNELSK